MSKNKNIPEIRIGGFNQPWVKKRLGDVLKHEQPWKYIESSTKYFNYGIPVLTPGKTFVLGYAKDSKNIKKASGNSPIILFDDFTTQSRFINFDFKVRSSALKFITNKNSKDNLKLVEKSQTISFLPMILITPLLLIFSSMFILKIWTNNLPHIITWS
ncbi:hypothetical protein, partial [Mesomycoplasma ovipneumoniae]